MPNLKAARADLQRAYTKLINRFGPDSEVIELLTNAINNLKEPNIIVHDEPATDSTEAAVVVEPEAELPTPPPAPRPTSRGRRR